MGWGRSSRARGRSEGLPCFVHETSSETEVNTGSANVAAAVYTGKNMMAGLVDNMLLLNTSSTRVAEAWEVRRRWGRKLGAPNERVDARTWIEI